MKVIGIGSFYGEDQLGWKIVDQLESELRSEKINFKKTQPAQLLHVLENENNVVILDALEDKSHPEPVKVLNNEDLFNDLPASTSSSHGINLVMQLQLARQLNALPEKIIIIGINTKNSTLPIEEIREIILNQAN